MKVLLRTMMNCNDVDLKVATIDQAIMIARPSVLTTPLQFDLDTPLHYHHEP